MYMGGGVGRRRGGEWEFCGFGCFIGSSSVTPG